ncbi:hypothetical protein V5F77_26040 [Xanthobacter sp. DSM 24535]
MASWDEALGAFLKPSVAMLGKRANCRTLVRRAVIRALASASPA